MSLPGSYSEPAAEPEAGAEVAPAPAVKMRRRYITGVDGLRALAVLAVLAYHLNLPWAQGGIVGVTVFFVISGFLITGILFAELDEKNSLDLKRFWVRRLRRLMPAVLLLLAVTAVASWFLNQGLLFKLRGDLLSTLLWFTNWWYIFRQQSYFEAISSPSPVLHFWSLAIEEQFYLVWPLVMLALWRLGVRRRGLRRTCFVLAVASAVAMAVLYDPTSDPSRVYYGTDTRAFSLLIGGWLALCYRASVRSPQHLTATWHRTLQRFVMGLVGLLGVAALAAMVAFIPGTDSFWYRGGFVVASICACLVIASVSMQGSLFCRVLSCAPLKWLGTRSYGIYLWHYPLLLLMNPSNASTADPVQVVLELVAILVAAELSYRLVENPIRHGAIGGCFRDLRAGELGALRGFRMVLATLATVALLGGAGTALALVPEVNNDQGLLTEADIQAGTSEGTIVKEDDSAAAPDGADADSDATASGDGSSGDATADADAAATGDATADAAGTGATDATAAADAATADAAEAEPVVTGYEPLMIGDSVSIGLTDVFHQAYTGGLIDACGNRQISMGQQVYDYYRDRGEVGTNVIIALGTNGSFTADQLEAFLADIGSERTVWLVANRVPSSWHRTTNQTIRDAAASHSNVHVIDWEAYSEGHDEWVGEDGIHLTYEGRVAYMQMIVDAIGSNKMIEAATKKANEAAGGAWVAPSDGSLSQEMYDALRLGMTPAARISRETTGEAAP